MTRGGGQRDIRAFLRFVSGRRATRLRYAPRGWAPFPEFDLSLKSSLFPPLLFRQVRNGLAQDDGARELV